MSGGGHGASKAARARSTLSRSSVPEELPPDNAARIAIFDAAVALAGPRRAKLSLAQVFERALPRLHVLMPREVHLAGERRYVQEKVEACVDDGVLVWANDPETLRLGERTPRIRYPDGSVRDYTPGLEPARDRLDRDNANLRARGFQVARAIPTVPRRSDSFQALVASMKEHGYLKQFPITQAADGEIIDGRARDAAAKLIGIATQRSSWGVPTADGTPPERRDTLLHRFLFALHTNGARLSEEDRAAAYDAVADRARRPWAEIAADLDLTREWRLTPPRRYTRRFDDVVQLRFREGEDPKVQVTRDRKVMLRSLVEAAGLQGYRINELLHYVPSERACTPFSGGRAAIFVNIDDAVDGIGRMQADRRANKRKIDRRWDQVRDWLAASENGGGRI